MGMPLAVMSGSGVGLSLRKTTVSFRRPIIKTAFQISLTILTIGYASTRSGEAPAKLPTYPQAKPRQGDETNKVSPVSKRTSLAKLTVGKSANNDYGRRDFATGKGLQRAG
jgi:hypothetical protein